eukprot:1458237-Alexandrium_andersonii.AAC.1
MLTIAERQGEGCVEAIRARLRDPSPHLGSAPECAEVVERLLPRRRVQLPAVNGPPSVVAPRAWVLQ